MEVPGLSLKQKDQFVLESQRQGTGVLSTGYGDAAAPPPNLFLVRFLWALGSKTASRAVYHGLCSQLALFNPSSATF